MFRLTTTTVFPDAVIYKCIYFLLPRHKQKWIFIYIFNFIINYLQNSIHVNFGLLVEYSAVCCQIDDRGSLLKRHSSIIILRKVNYYV